MPEQLAAQIQHMLATPADPARAVPMRAYMRDRFPFLGIQTPTRRAALRPLFKGDFEQKRLLTAADQLWCLPEREYRYATIDLLARHVSRLDMSAVAPLLTLAQRDPWWDTVDGLAGSSATCFALRAATIRARRARWMRRCATIACGCGASQ